MGLFEKIFGSRKKAGDAAATYFRLLNGYQPVFRSWNGKIYESELIRASIDARARHISKLQVVMSGTAQPKLKTQVSGAPNTFQTWGQFLYRLSTILDVRNTAFIVPILDEFGRTTGFYPICPALWELVQVNGVPWIRFRFDAGQTAAIELSRVGVLTKFQYQSEFFGETNSVLKETMELIGIQRQGIEESAKNSASYRLMAKVSNFTKAEDLAKERQRFDAENFQNGGGGVLLFPNTYTDIQQLKQQSYSVDADQLKLIQGNVYNYFGVNEDVLQNKTYGDAWSAFYEGAIEPFSVQLSDVMTNMTFSQKEQAYGSRFTFTANRLQYMSNADKLSVSSQMMDRGVFSINDVRTIWNLEPVEGGDRRIIRGEYYDVSEKMEGENET